MKQSLRTPFSRLFDAEQSALVRQGFRPRRPADRWLIVHTPGLLSFRRALTGTLIFQVLLHERGDNLETTEAILNRDPDEYRGGNVADDVALIHFLIDRHLLGLEDARLERTGLESVTTRAVAQWTSGALDGDDD